MSDRSMKTAGVVSEKSEVSPGPSVPIGWRVDWDEYFREFCRVHGRVVDPGTGEVLVSTGPVHLRGRLLFPDGWSYSDRDPRGPEWPPPEIPEKLRQVKRVYWRLMVRMVLEEIRLIEGWVEVMEREERMRGSPIRLNMSVYDTETGRIRQEKDGKAVLEGRILWLRGSLRDCQRYAEQFRRVKI